MNIYESDVLKAILAEGPSSQRLLAEVTGFSVGNINKCLKALRASGMIDDRGQPTQKTRELIDSNSPTNAIILAAGFGMRMMPINNLMPKGLIEIEGETLIERTIRQLHEAGITDITVVVGFMKEWYEYLQSKHGVRLVTNRDYVYKNNLHSLYSAVEYIKNTYIIPCDIWCRTNPYSRYELDSWYMAGKWTDFDSNVKVNKKLCFVPAKQGEGCAMIGISYIHGAASEKLRETLRKYTALRQYDKAYWETAITENRTLILPARLVNEGECIEINTFEQLREMDKNSDQLKAPAIKVICSVLNTDIEEILNIRALKKGMTNRSFMFECRGERYIMRIPGEGTDKLINRAQEAAVYKTINAEGICDDVIYIDPSNGYKITRFIENARTCNPQNKDDILKCMAKLRQFHDSCMKVEHYFDIFGQIELYESFRNGEPSAYRDYDSTKESVYMLKGFVESLKKDCCLTHIDAVADNFLMFSEGGEEKIVLIDWEYAAMQDPHVDIAMFCIYSMLEREQIDEVIDAYFYGSADELTRYKIYAYIAMCGLLWSNWCEFKIRCGIDFGEYSVSQYRYARRYSSIVLEYLNRREKNEP